MPTTIHPTPTLIPAIGDVYDGAQVATYLAIHERTVRWYATRGTITPTGERVTLPRVKLGGRVWYRVSDIEAFVGRLWSDVATAGPTTTATVDVPARRAVPKDVAERLRRRGFTVGGA